MKSRGLRDQLIQLLKKDHLLSANQIIMKLEEKGHNYHKTSIYRSIEKLLDEDIICRHQFDPSEALYELREDHHAHLYCSNCGKVKSADFNMKIPSNVAGYKIDHQHLTLIGLCKECQT